jgi:hypothetical protein
MAKGWQRRFDDPIPLPDGTGELTTLREAVAYLAKTVPKAERNMPEVLAAAEALTLRPNGRSPGCSWRGLAC